MHGATAQGAIHLRASKPNQDSISWSQPQLNDLPIILAVSDGHGEEQYFRSDRGSRFAVEAAIQSLGDLLEQTSERSEDSFAPREAAQLLPKTLVRRWRALVDADALTSPLGDLEAPPARLDAGPTTTEMDTNDHRVPYGATLLAVLLTANFHIYAQIGDGDILLYDDQGHCTRPIPRDTRHVGNQTTSLCSTTAIADLNILFRSIDNPLPSLVIVATDGYSNSFESSPAFQKVGTDILSLVNQKGPSIIPRELPLWLRRASDLGSGDDVTAGVIMRVAAAPS